MNPARVAHFILHPQCLKEFLGRNAQLRHAGAGHLDIDRLGTLSPEGDLGHIGHQQQLSLEELGDVPQLRIGIAVAGQAQKNPEGIAKIVVDDGRLYPQRQLGLNIAHLAAQFIPNLGQAGPVVLLRHCRIDDRETGPRDGPHLLELAPGLDGFLNSLRDLFLHLPGTGPGILSRDDRIFDGKLGIFQTSQRLERVNTTNQCDRRQNQRGGASGDGEFGEIHCLSLSSPAI